MSKFVRWETPFTEITFPSVRLIATSTSKQWNDVMTLVTLKEEDPRYLISFGDALAFACFEEAHAPERDFSSAVVEEPNLCAYQYIGSPWVNAYEAWVEHISFPNPPVPLFHYLIFGGDNNIEVVTTNVPTIREIERSETLRLDVHL